MTNQSRTAVIIGAGPAGLTAAYELATRTDIRPVVLESSDQVGGIARTIVHNGNRIDIGGHRFFSKSDRVMNWWLSIMPLEQRAAGELAIAYQGQTRTLPAEGEPGADPEMVDLVMLVRERRSRIFHLRKFFDYPVALNLQTMRNLGLRRMMRIGASYLWALARPRTPERSLEDFLINRFGHELYRTFFRDYTEKVWGVPCREIGAEWGAQRIKGLSVTKALRHHLQKILGRHRRDLSQKGTETSLIERFLYPKLGPGQIWEEVARRIAELGGEVQMASRVTGLVTQGAAVVAVVCEDRDGTRHRVAADFVFSTMPISELVSALDAEVPPEVAEVASGLPYRDFITVGMLLRELRVREADGGPIRDNWIYIQESDVKVGRMQIFNNWSPYMVGVPGKVWIGLEYFCNSTDDLWALGDEAMIALATDELEKIGIAHRGDVEDAVVIRMPKTYPAYFGTYDQFATVRDYLDRFGNLFLIGRNGMHRYNNQDHSMLTAMTAVDNILAGVKNKTNLWAINTEEDYHEEK